MEDLVKFRQQGLSIVVAVAWACSAIIAFGAFLAESGIVPVVLALAITAYPTLAYFRKASDTVSRFVIGGTMPLYCAILLLQWSGSAWQIDLHMAFFAMIAILAIFADWRPVLAGAGVTAVHHLVLNYAAPTLVFTGGEPDLGRVVLHAVIVVVETAVLVTLTVRLEALIIAQFTGERERIELEAATNAERTRRQNEQQGVVEKVEAGLKALARGDLDCPIQHPFPPVFEPLRTDFNTTVATLRSLVSSVAGSSRQIEASVSEIHHAADDLARRTEIDAATVEQAAHTITQMTASATSAATRATEVQGALDESQQRAVRGREIVTRAMTSVQKIEQSANEIGNIVTLIDGIAFQTNLLALNAGVEAARAGEAGKGFAVVATEVRALAERTTEAARNIKALINTSTVQVSEGVDYVTQAGTVLQDVMVEVSEIGALVTEITEATRSTAQVLSGVQNTFVAIDKSTQQNAAMVEESNAAVRSLAQEAKALMATLGQFSLRDDRSPLRAAA
ncbi:MAG: methyl-accepting chemotaxis protein [Novosphingobium sp.]|uniref:methyl-accepting chemotaxis protein n=1 Tax=Novosphingobium sp. TaxID=1874826 RepID=UPI003B9B97EE